jgi:hypothetical protein
MCKEPRDGSGTQQRIYIENEDQQALAVRKLLVGERGSAGVSRGAITGMTLHAATAIPRLNVSFCATLRAWSLRPRLFQSALDEVRQRFDNRLPRNLSEHLPDHPSHTLRRAVYISSKTRLELIYYRTRHESLDYTIGTAFIYYYWQLSVD